MSSFVSKVLCTNFSLDFTMSSTLSLNCDASMRFLSFSFALLFLPGFYDNVTYHLRFSVVEEGSEMATTGKMVGWGGQGECGCQHGGLGWRELASNER
jgi:hypothetical protein